MIHLRDIARFYGPVVALDGVSLQARAGRVLGVLGENGAGKSTLMRILYGLERPDRGEITIAGAPTVLRSPRDASRLGIGMVHQHFTLVPTLTVLDTCILAAEIGLGPVDRSAWSARIAEVAQRLHWQVDPTARISSLSVGQQQRVEILKALLTGGRMLILDEPTAVLTPQEVDELIPALRRLADHGTTVLFISHKLHEVQRLCDDVVILRHGRVVHAGACAELTREQMAELMVGAAVALPTPARVTAPGAVRLAVRSVTGNGLHNVSCNVHGGEIVGIAGVDGNGQTQLIEAVLTNGEAVETPGIPAHERLAGERRIALIPDDRQHQALILSLSIERNVVLKDHARPPFAWHGWLNFAQWRRHARLLIERFSIRGGGAHSPVAALSGGNQQKVVIARELHREPQVILAINPTRGLDIAASAAVLQRLVAARERGAGVLLVHHDLDELLAVADRVLVLYNGHLTDSGWPNATREHLGQLMLGGLEPARIPGIIPGTASLQTGPCESRSEHDPLLPDRLSPDPLSPDPTARAPDA